MRAKQIKVLQPAMGHRLDANEERTGRRTDADTCSLRRTEQGYRSELLQDALGAFLETARASSKPAQVSDGARNRERTRRERSSEIGSAALRPLHAIYLLFLLPLPFIAREEAVWH